MGKKIKKQSSPSEMSEVAKGISMILQIGISMIVPVGLCLFLGYKLDTWLNKSCFMIIFMILGFLAGIRSVYSITKSFYAKDLKKEKENQKNGLTIFCPSVIVIRAYLRQIWRRSSAG